MQEPANSGAANAATQTEVKPPAVEPDAGIVSSLVGMGFTENGSKRAAVATQVRFLACQTSSHLQAVQPVPHPRWTVTESLMTENQAEKEPSAQSMTPFQAAPRCQCCSCALFQAAHPRSECYSKREVDRSSKPLALLESAFGLVQNAGTEAAMEWVLSHMGDPDFNEPLPASSSSQAPAQAQQQGSQKAADPEQVSMLGAMGFTPQQVTCSP